MTCQTGIRADSKLLEFFDQCKQCKIRFGKIVINNASLNVNYHLNPSKDWRKDWKKCLPECVDSYEPCFLLFRFDSGHDWILISFADDKASVKDKMLLAATKATFKSEFGQSFIHAEYQISNRNELQLDNFEKNYLNKDAENSAIEDGDEAKPLSFVERELSSVTKERANIPFSLHASQTMRGVQFPIDQDAEEKLRSFASGQCDFVQLSVDCLNEAIKLEAHHTILQDISQLENLVPKKSPRYSLLRFKNENLAKGEAIFFIYSIPPSQSCTIKELMLFSSCKGPLIGEIESKSIGIVIDKKIQVDSRDKLDKTTLLDYMTPETCVAILENNSPSNNGQQQFERPPRPGGGPRRIIKKM